MPNLEKHWFHGATKGERLVYLRSLPEWQPLIPALRLADLGSCETVVTEMNLEPSQRICVRSSFAGEDGSESMAGKYLSLLNVEMNLVLEATRTVLASNSEATSNEHVIIQEMVNDPELSGVVFTSNPRTGLPQFIVEWSHGSSTDAVTSGTQPVESVCLSHTRELTSVALDEDLLWIEELVRLSNLLQELTGEISLDIEFVLDSFGKLWILQVRPLRIEARERELEVWEREIASAYKFVAQRQSEALSIGRSKPIFGVMPDWNPAELIGLSPRELAMSAFRFLISDATWAYERSNLGYRSMRGHPLIVEIQGVPFVDVAVSAESLVPSSLSNDVASELIRCELDYLRENPSLHDKVEFEVFATEWNVGTEALLERIGLEKKSRALVSESLQQLTREILQPRNRGYGLADSLRRSADLSARFREVETSGLSNFAKAFWHLENCRRFGTLPFGGVARCAFIATSILRNMAKFDDGIQESELEVFMQSLHSPIDDLELLRSKGNWEELVLHFGHLRPGTFEVTHAPYHKDPEKFLFSPAREPVEHLARGPKDRAHVDESLAKKLDTSLTLQSLGVGGREFVSFCRQSIEGREWLKFEFSKNISKALDAIAAGAEELEISAEQISHCNLRAITEQVISDSFSADRILEQVAEGKQRYLTRQDAQLPLLILDENDVLVSRQFKSVPNFVTRGYVTAEVVHLSDTTTEDLSGKIVCIPSADPGFDWLFSRQIGGLITEFGGANSHMAIRCNELQLPAAIGVGPRIMTQVRRIERLTIDCVAKRIEFHH